MGGQHEKMAEEDNKIGQKKTYLLYMLKSEGASKPFTIGRIFTWMLLSWLNLFPMVETINYYCLMLSDKLVDGDNLDDIKDMGWQVFYVIFNTFT